MKGGLPEFLRARLDPAQRYGLRVTLFFIALLIVALPFSYLLTQVQTSGPLTEIDTELAQDINEWIHASTFLVALSYVVSFLASPPWFWLLVGGCAIWFFRRGDRRLALFVVATSIGGGAISTVIKVVVDRERPEVDQPIAEAFGKSFPSGHAMGATYVYGALLLAFMPFIPRRARGWAIAAWLLVVTFVSLSRLGLGVHFLTDVLGGFVLGLAWLAVATAAFSIWRREEGEAPVEVLEGAEPEAARH
ncbi:MAG TPA: phosphatase PAP2 family protein [Actinomycetota bacterium]|nr:phosphatase PAP2 family protein [Actinomycetota bacterium]